MTVCVSPNFTTPGGVLTRAAHVSVQMVADSGFVASVPALNIDLMASPQRFLPGLTTHDFTVAAPSNASGQVLRYHIYVTNRNRYAVVGSPNMVQFRDSYEYTLDGSAPTLPDVERTLRSQSGISVDRGTNNTAQPQCAYAFGYGATAQTVEAVDVPPGLQLKVRYRQIVWTPPPFSNNAAVLCSGTPPTTVARGGESRVHIVAFPTISSDL